MPEQYTITGTITLADDANRAGIKVQAFDRDLPSLERRTGLAPQKLGDDGITDAEGRFQITYTLEQFQSGEGIPQFRRLRRKNADLSFRVFDSSGRELTIRNIDALDREFGPDQIIFNIPSSLEVIIYLDAPQQLGASEYEQLIALIAPVIADVPLVELSDEDIVFLKNELGLEQQPETQQHIDWLRRSALLAQEISLPAEVFYGWGRKELPTQLSELTAIPLKDLPTLVDKLADLPVDRLRDTLLAAIEENIIPVHFRERVSIIANALRRRAQIEITVSIRLELAPTGEPLIGYTITTFDTDANNRDLGTDVTDALGEFVIAYFADTVVGDVERSLRFRIRGPDIADAIEVTQHIPSNAPAVISVAVQLPGINPTLQKLHEDGHIDVPKDLVVLLDQKHGIRSLADIRRRGGLSRIAELRELDSSATSRLDSLADLDRLSSDLKETSVLLDYGFDSVFTISEALRSEFIASMTSNKAGFSERRATELHVAAKAQTDILDQIFAGIAIDFASGTRPSSGFVAGDYFPPFPEEQKNG